MNKILLGLALALTVTGAGINADAKEYLVKYRSAFGTMSFSNKIQTMEINSNANLAKISISDMNAVQAMLDLYSNPNVEYVVPNVRMYAFKPMVSTLALKDQWAIKKVKAEAAWAKLGNKGSRKVVVAVIDTGVDYKHKALAPNMIPGYDFAKNDSDPMDETGSQNPGHGTHCAGIVGSSGLVDGGTVGASPEVSIMPIRFLDQNGGGDLNNGIKAIDYAIEKKVDVISASWGAAISKSQAQPLVEAVARAEKAGITFVVAAANDGKSNDVASMYPANAGTSNSISVAASDSSDAKPSWSNYGQAMVAIASPGAGIMSTLPKDKYGNLDGTSMATPLVAGIVALVKSADANLKPDEIRSLLQATGDKVSISTQCDCRVNAESAVDAILAKKMFVHPQAGTYAVGATAGFTGVYGSAPFTFESSNPAAATITEAGVLTAVANGETTVKVTDSKGVVATSYKIHVGKSSSGGGDDPGQDPGNPGGGDCPLGNEQLCQIICQIMPTAPWCTTN